MVFEAQMPIGLADGYETFPLNTLLKVTGRNVTRNEDEYCYRSNIFEELEFLTQALKEV